MRRSTFVTVASAPNSSAAEIMATLLRGAGLHPADIALVAPLPAQRAKLSFPVEVPPEEAEAARKALSAHSESGQ